MWYLADALRAGFSIEQIYVLTFIDPWFLHNIAQIVAMEGRLMAAGEGFARADEAFAELLREAKEYGFSDRRLAALWGVTEGDVRELRQRLGIRPVYKRVDTCGAEFEAFTPYLYSTYETECEAQPSDRQKIMILGGGPNRIGQGIEFDYCCVHAVQSFRALGYEAVMVNCNPETVSTDYDTSDRLYFEPLDAESVLAVCDRERPAGVVIQFGGQTPLKLARAIDEASLVARAVRSRVGNCGGWCVGRCLLTSGCGGLRLCCGPRRIAGRGAGCGFLCGGRRPRSPPGRSNRRRHGSRGLSGIFCCARL